MSTIIIANSLAPHMICKKPAKKPRREGGVLVITVSVAKTYSAVSSAAFLFAFLTALVGTVVSSAGPAGASASSAVKS